MCVCACVHVSVGCGCGCGCVCVRACMRACVYHVCVCVCVFTNLLLAPTGCFLNPFPTGLSAACPEAAARLPRPGSSFVLCNDESLTCVGNVSFTPHCALP